MAQLQQRRRRFGRLAVAGALLASLLAPSSLTAQAQVQTVPVPPASLDPIRASARP
jgi:hypothetical protein